MEKRRTFHKYKWEHMRGRNEKLSEAKRAALYRRWKRTHFKKGELIRNKKVHFPGLKNPIIF